MGTDDLKYWLSFLEFEENGKFVGIPTKSGKKKELVQFKQLMAHFVKYKNREHHVIAFIHGWRHDAKVGDTDVALLRLNAAHAASFIRQRCISKNKYSKERSNERIECPMVTAIYIGWRGARFIEFEGWSSYVSGFFASTTLFDRKPVSEAIGPSVVSALKEVSTKLTKLNKNSRYDYFWSQPWRQHARFKS